MVYAYVCSLCSAECICILIETIWYLSYKLINYLKPFTYLYDILYIHLTIYYAEVYYSISIRLSVNTNYSSIVLLYKTI